MTHHHLIQELVDQSEVHADGFLTHAAAVILNQTHKPARDTSQQRNYFIKTITHIIQSQKHHSEQQHRYRYRAEHRSVSSVYLFRNSTTVNGEGSVFVDTTQ